MLKKMILFLITFFILSGCASRPHIEIVRPDGGPSPDPYYYLQTTGKFPMRVSFYYASTTRVEDLDGSKQPSISYLERRKVHYLKKDSIADLHIVLGVLNPGNMRYKVRYRMHVSYSNSGQVDSYLEIAHSDMKYREIICSLPLTDGIEKVNHEVVVTDETGNVLIRTGQFKYYVN